MINKTIFNPKYKSMIHSLILARNKYGISQRDLAAKLNKAHSYIGRIETFERRLDVIDLINIARALELSEREIIKIFKNLL